MKWLKEVKAHSIKTKEDVISLLLTVSNPSEKSDLEKADISESRLANSKYVIEYSSAQGYTPKISFASNQDELKNIIKEDVITADYYAIVNLETKKEITFELDILLNE
jgi:hypothetical protein